jgi:hypothetical protein
MVGADDRAGSGLSQPGAATNRKHEEDGNAATDAGTNNEHEYPSLQSGLGGLKEKWGQAAGCILHSGVAGPPILVEIKVIDGQNLLEPRN